jgi:hydroxymethylpyrimidine pyrophosphatase-like HAD family hydrolase
MKYKMLVIDMDDTLLTDDHTISEENRNAFKAQEKRFMLFWHQETNTSDASILKELKLDNSYMISYNGAVITDLKRIK